MGYILPVNHYQYQDYQIRTTQHERSPFVLEKVFKATLDSNLKHNYPPEQDRVEDQGRKTLHITKNTHAMKSVHSSFQRSGTEKILSNMTGKGRYFSETV
ncbi:hypothetical protein LC065_18765 [Halobacillus litoralis]|uniref:hypothetical protein n=1 Tax=Halobacillus litoralis TaxID=45668 RepID=UPI001CFF23D8|nr:hypothetical protein [Halobacillus litoralis]WLR47518.1 hypothetical protein LC065_18765 [Halobacillus litoralis]